jgi:hypothetical protein
MCCNCVIRAESMQDTPGTHLAGVDNAILKHIIKQNRDYMSKEEDPKRVVPLSTLPDPRVDAALFFLSPHYLKPQEVELMTKVAKFVPVVPIIAKVLLPNHIQHSPLVSFPNWRAQPKSMR